MVFVFWQNIVSIHQQAFLEALAVRPDVQKVLLVVEQSLPEIRKKMGWTVPQLNGVQVISLAHMPVKEIVAANKDGVHIMSGIRSTPMLRQAFDACIANNCRMGVMTEPYDSAGIKGLLRRYKYGRLKSEYGKYIQFVLAIGKQSVAQFIGLGYDAHVLFPWAYFLPSPGAKHTRDPIGEVRIIYAGRVTEPKGIYKFVQALTSTASSGYRLDIYGEGSDAKKIRELAATRRLNDKITIAPFIKHEELNQKYGEYHWVVLPSTQKDGWGAIVSEGMLNGLKAICSRKCGASWAVKEGVNGVTFDWTERGSCGHAIQKMLSDNGFASATRISEWANNALSGKAGAQYFVRIIKCVYEREDRPVIPWEQF